MPAKDLYHDTVIRALEKEGWLITSDPFFLKYGDRRMYVDLGAQLNTVGAERDGQKIAVEIKSFIGSSPVSDMEQAALYTNEFYLYRNRTEPCIWQFPDAPM